MDMPLEEIKYSSPDNDNLCFRHAVFAAMTGLHIRAVISERPPTCEHCEEDAIIINLRKNSWSSEAIRVNIE